MEMLYGGVGAMLLAWYVGRKWFKLGDVGTIVVMTIAGGGSLITGLIYLWVGDVSIGNDGSLLWFLVGALGGAMGIGVYFVVSYADWFTDQLKKNGML
ncbi:hypothetical protein EON83_26135 [bacterium]|nr:MAG: hypothetical protein EON83_26135 [bacterium]